jgi:uncharacterized protein with GYD domain
MLDSGQEVSTMPTYMVMVKFTDQGARNLKELSNL